MVGFFPRTAVVGVVALGAGCDVDFVSESGRLGFAAPELHRTGLGDFASGDPIAVGSRVCPQFDGYQEDDEYREISDDDDSELRACFEIGASGPASFDGRCLEIEGAGEITWSLQARDGTCIPGVIFSDDEVRFEGVALADVVTEEAALVERLAEGDGWTISGEMTPADLVPPIGAPLVIAEGVAVTASIGLRDPARDIAVAWTDGEIVVTPASAEVPSPADDDEENEPDDTVGLRLGAGETAEVAMHVADEPAPPLVVESVPVDTLTELQVVAFFSLDGESPIPAILRAVARDENGRLVRGVPVEWSTEGGLNTMPLWGDDRDPDYVVADVTCREPDEPEASEQGTVTATLGDQVATLEVTWMRPLCAEELEGDDGRPGGADDGDASDGRDDEGGLASCACTTGSGGPSPMGLVLLGGGMAWLRRRRRAQPAR